MPTFPNINTLTLVNPTGEEEIQIAATKRAKLKNIAALALKLLGENIAYSYVKYNDIGNPRYRGFVGYIYNTGRSQYEVLALEFDTNSFDLRFGYVNVPNIIIPEGARQADYLIGLIQNWYTISSSDKFRATESGEVIVRPGEQVYSYGTPSNIDFPKVSWNIPNEGSNGKIYQASILSYGANITKSMFSAVGDDATPVINFIFSEDFDEDPGTDYQMIAFQAYRVTSTQIIILVNKAGYSA